MTVLESYATMVAVVETDEDYGDHRVKTDGGVVTLVSVPSALDVLGDAAEDAVVWVVSQISGAVQYERTDAATVTLTGRPSATEFRGVTYTDAATVGLTPLPSDTEIYGHAEAATVHLTPVITALNTHEYPEAESIVRVHGTVSAAEERDYPDDNATVHLTPVPSGTDLKAHWYADAATLTWSVDQISGLDSEQFAPDAATITYHVDQISGIDTHQNVDTGTVHLTPVPSGTDLKAHWFVDADTVHLSPFEPAVESDDHVDDAVVHLTPVPSGTDIKAKWYEDADTITYVADQIDAVDEYTPGDTQVMLFGAENYGGSGVFGNPGRTLIIPIGTTASAGDWLVFGSISSAGGSDVGTPPAVTDNIDTLGADWVQDVEGSLGGGGYGAGTSHITWWRKLCVGGETTVTCDYFISTNKAIAGAWIKPTGGRTLYKISDGDSSWDGLNKIRTVSPTTADAQTYISMGLGGGTGNSDVSSFEMFVNRVIGGWVGPTDTLSELAPGECFAGAAYESTESLNLSTDQIIQRCTPNTYFYVAFYGIH